MLGVATPGSKLLLLRLDTDGTLTEVGQPPELDGTYGRLLAVHPGPPSELFVTTSNGGDKVRRVSAA